MEAKIDEFLNVASGGGVLRRIKKSGIDPWRTFWSSKNDAHDLRFAGKINLRADDGGMWTRRGSLSMQQT